MDIYTTHQCLNKNKKIYLHQIFSYRFGLKSLITLKKHFTIGLLIRVW